MTERAQRVDDLDEPQPPRLGGEVLGVARDEGEGAQVGVEAALDARPQHLDRDRARSARRRDLRAMHLGDRGGRDRRTKMREHRADRPAERGRDHRFRLVLRKRRHLVLQPFEIAGEHCTDNIRARRQELPELDVARPEPRERRRQPRFHSPAGRALEQPRDTQQRPRRRRHHRRIDGAEHALAGEHEAGSAETDEMRGTGDHKRQPECNATIPPVIT